MLCYALSMQLELVLNCEETRLPDGRIVLTPGKLLPKAKEEWRKMSEVMAEMPYKDRQANVDLIEVTKEIRGRRLHKRGHWWVEMNSVRAFFKSKEA